MSVVVVLRVALGIVDVALGIVVPLVEDAAAAQRLADDGVAGLVQDPLAVLYLASGGRHGVELGPAQLGKIDHCLVNSKVLICTIESRADKRSAQRPRAAATALPDLHESTRPAPIVQRGPASSLMRRSVQVTSRFMTLPSASL